MAYELEDAISSILRWLDLSLDLMVVGDEGSGRTSVLVETRRRLQLLGRDSVLIEGSLSSAAIPYAPLRAIAALQRRLDGPVPPEMLQSSVADELGAGGVLVIDDFDLLDDDSLTLLGPLLRSKSVAVVVAAGAGFPRSCDQTRHASLGARAMAEVRINPVGFQEMSSIVAARLGGQPDAPLISSVVSRSAGNPRVGEALVVAARWSGAIEVRGGVWTETGSFDQVPLEAATSALTARLSAPEVDALELLSWTGALPFAEATQLIDPAVLASLGDRLRLRVHRSGGTDVVTVSPPALASAFLRRLTPVRRRLFAERIRLAFGRTQQNRLPESPLHDILAFDAFGSEEYWRWAAELAALVHERSGVQEASLHARWRADPSVVNAVTFLERTLGYRSSVSIADIFARTIVDDDEDPELLTRFLLLETHWRAGSGGPESVHEIFERGSTLMPERSAFFSRLSTLYSRESTDLDGGLPGDASADPVTEDWMRVATANILLERGRPREALEIVAPKDRPPANKHVGLFLLAAESDALFLAGDLDALERFSKRELELASDDLDPARIRAHALGLAEALYVGNNPTAAWRMLSTSLRLGPPGPLDTGRYRRTLALSIVIQQQIGDEQSASILRRELERTDEAMREPLGDMHAWTTTLHRTADDPGGAGEAQWRAGIEAARRGLVTAAQLRWASRTAVYTPQQMHEIEDVLRDMPRGLFSPLLDLHSAMVGGTEKSIRLALAAIPTAVMPGLTRTAIDRIQYLRARASQSALSEPEVVALAGGSVQGLTVRGASAPPPSGTPLSVREREVAVLARAGYSNRDIARRLTVSVRTVENHMYRVLRKLALSNRAELMTDWDPVRES